MGHKVTVYEKCAKLGGMLRYGIPNYRLPREVLDAEIASMLALGIDVHVNVNVGDDVTFDELRQQNDALYIALGAHTDKKTGIEGEDAGGVISAVEMLREIGDDHMPDFRNKDIVVIGGGNAAKDFGSVENLLLAVFVLVVILFFKHWTKGFLSSSSILVGIIAGYLAAIVMGFVLPTTGVTADGVEFTKAWVLNWNKVAEASWFAIPKLVPVKIVFDLRAILPVMIMFIVTAVETVGDISGVMEGGMSREATDKELSGGVICDGLGSSFAACFGVLPNTSFSQNVGLVAMTKVVNRGALATGAIFLMLCGLIPKLGALISIMPQAVLGGAAVMMFSSIVVSGIQLITKEKMTPRHLTIVSVALGVGYGMGANSGILAQAPQVFQLICGESGIVPAAFVAILLNVLLPKNDMAE